MDPHAVPQEHPAVSVSGLSKHFSRVRAVDDVNATIPIGGVYGLLGPNGSGKTTLLSMLAGYLKPTAGSIELLGHGGNDGLAQARARMGWLIERPLFWPHLSCRDNLKCLQGIFRSDGSGEDIDRLLGMVGLDGDAAGRKFRACSTGMKQRLGIAATLLGDPPLLILDEPTNGLDPAGIIEVRELIRELGQSKTADGNVQRTVILSSHLLNEVEQVCSRVGVMARGKLLYSGPVGEIAGKSLVLVRTTDDAEADSVLRRAGWEVAGRKDEGMEVAASPGREWEITRDLSAAGIYVSEMRPMGGALEAGYLQVTGEPDGR